MSHNFIVLSLEQDAMQFNVGNSFKYITLIECPSRIVISFKLESSKLNDQISSSGSKEDVIKIFADFRNNIQVISTLYGFIVLIQEYLIGKFSDLDIFLLVTISSGIVL